MNSSDLKGLSDNQVRSALGQALTKLTASQKVARTVKENAGTTVQHLVHTGETQGALFLASMGEGFQLARGKSLKVGPVDLRVMTGAPLMMWGIVDCLRGKGGTHQMAIANGLIGSAVASLGLQAGQALAEKRGNTPEAAATTTTAPAQMTQQSDGLTLSLTPEVQGTREVLLHPAHEDASPRKKRRIAR